VASITAENLPLFRATRLRALQEDPAAFGSTYAEESKFTGAEWAARLRRWNGERGIGFLALDLENGGEMPCGIAGALVDDADPRSAQLVSMWTAPTHRRLGVGRILVQAVLAWAASRGLHTLTLFVVANNSPAIRFYRQLGFAVTGNTQPYPNDPALTEYEMSRPVDFIGKQSIA